jgi:hypothetical protein
MKREWKRVVTPAWLALVLLLATVATQRPAHARPPANIGLSRFEAFPLSDGVRLEWDTETELGTAGFTFKRGTGGDFDYIEDPATEARVFVPSDGGPSIGSSYVFQDLTATYGETYTYQLIEVTAGGDEVNQAEVTVTVEVVPTETPIVVPTLGGGGAGGSTQATATATPTATVATAEGTPAPPVATVAADSTLSALQAVPPTATLAVVTPPDDEAPEFAGVSEDGDSGTFFDDAPVSGGDEAADLASEVVLFDQEATAASVNGDASSQSVAGIAANVVAAASGAEGTPAVIAAAVQNPALPQAIGAEPSSDQALPAVAPAAQEGQQTPAVDPYPGRLYLWIAFAAALIIFVAAVVGAIVLYTRRRTAK